MGYSTRNNGDIRDFWPDDDADNLYITGSPLLDEIVERARAHFGERFDLNRIIIEPEHIHTSCLTYDQYDGSDWTNFIHISLVG